MDKKTAVPSPNPEPGARSPELISDDEQRFLALARRLVERAETRLAAAQEQFQAMAGLFQDKYSLAIGDTIDEAGRIVRAEGAGQGEK